MMTKTTSKISAYARKISILPLLTAIIYFMCVDVVAHIIEIPANHTLKELTEKAILANTKYNTQTSEKNTSQTHINTHKQAKSITDTTQNSEKTETNSIKKTIQKENKQEKTKDSIKRTKQTVKICYVYDTNDTAYWAIKEKDKPVEFYNRQGQVVTDPKLISSFKEQLKNKNWGETNNFSITPMQGQNNQSGYILHENNVYFTAVAENGERQYYNRWGVKMSDTNIITELSKSEIISDVEKLKEKQIKTPEPNLTNFELGCKYGDITKKDNQFYINDNAVDLMEKLEETGYLYVNTTISDTKTKTGTYWYSIENNKLQVYDRWGQLSEELMQFLNN